MANIIVILQQCGMLVLIGIAGGWLYAMFTVTHPDSNAGRIAAETFGISFCAMVMIIPPADFGLSMFVSASKALRSFFGSDVSRLGWLERFLSDRANISKVLPYAIIIMTLFLLLYIFTAGKGKKLTALSFLPLAMIIECTVMTVFIESSFSFGIFLLAEIIFLFGG